MCHKPRNPAANLVPRVLPPLHRHAPCHEVGLHLCGRLRKVLKCQTLLLTWRMSVSVRISDFPIISGKGSSIEHILQELKKPNSENLTVKEKEKKREREKERKREGEKERRREGEKERRREGEKERRGRGRGKGGRGRGRERERELPWFSLWFLYFCFFLFSLSFLAILFCLAVCSRGTRTKDVWLFKPKYIQSQHSNNLSTVTTSAQ